ncbi:unnamed protein product [Urochloa humidicola]
MKSFPVAGGRSVSLALYSDVSNSRELLDLMQSGKLEPEVAFLNASLVPDVFPVLAAAHKALLSKARESLTTRTLHSELVYNYSGSKHITESLKRCGISDDTTYILAARFDASDEEEHKQRKLGFAPPSSSKSKIPAKRAAHVVASGSSPQEHQMKAVDKLIKGGEVDLGELESRADQQQILKHYKIPPLELLISTLPDAIVCRIAARDAL